jgi:hypothetical protein
MRHELADYEWVAIKPMLPNKAAWRSSGEQPTCPQRHFLGHAIRRALARSASGIRSLHHLLQALCSLAPRWCLGPHHGRTCRCHDAAVQMIDTSIVRVHQHGVCITRNQRQSMGGSRGGLTSTIHAVVDSNGLPVRLAVIWTPGNIFKSDDRHSPT